MTGEDAVENGKVSPNSVTLTGVNKFVDGAVDVGVEGGDKVKDKKVVADMVGPIQLFRYSDATDKLLIALGIFMSVCNGVAMPAMIIIFGDMINEFVNADLSILALPTGNTTGLSSDRLGEITSRLVTNMRYFCLIFVGLGVAVWIVSYGQMACWGTTAERQVRRIRFLLFNKILRMHVGWFDVRDIGEMNSRLTELVIAVFLDCLPSITITVIETRTPKLSGRTGNIGHYQC